MAKKIVTLFLGIGYLLFGSALVYADTKPYFKVFGGDVFAGGWFNSGNNNCSTGDGNYQAPVISPLSGQYKGGILAFATTNRTGSSVDFGALAMGLIEGETTNQYGFYSGQTTSINSLSFANTENAVSGSYWGGYLAGASPQVHCIPDYYTKKQSTSPPPINAGSSFNVGLLEHTTPQGPIHVIGQYTTPPGGAEITFGGPATINPGTNITVFVNGNAYISNDIVYADGYNADNVPKLTIVAKGDIFVAPSVGRIDGFYIAQPSSGNSGGTFWSCHDGSLSLPPDYGRWIAAHCNSRLTINGAVVAKQTNLLRINGDIGDNNSNPAEVINYTPEMVMGGPFFNPPANQDPKINALINLPPVF